MNKRYIYATIALILVVFATYEAFFRTDPKVEALNRAIATQSDQALRRYPYPFHVMRMDGSIAVMGSPRSAEMPVSQMIRAIDPHLEGASPTDPDFVAAEQQMAKLQFEARAIVMKQPGVTGVRFELDKDWLQEHQIDTDQ